MTDYYIIIDNVKKIIAKFLAQNGGRSNGYETYAEGSCQKNSLHAVNWMTPKATDLTLYQHKSAGYKLCDEINHYLKQINFDNQVIISKYPTEYGCYETTVSINLSSKVDLEENQ